MHIGIDARLYGLEHAGIGRYVKNIVDRIITSSSNHDFTLFLNEPYYSRLNTPESVKKILAKIKHYSFHEQVGMVPLFYQKKLDLLHVPHFNVPLLYNQPFVVTIHDILWHQVRGANVTTLSPFMYRAKYIAYKAVVWHAVTYARSIMVPSQYVKHQLMQEFPQLPESNIYVTYEGVDVNLHPDKEKTQHFALRTPYLLYVGSCYPHKNVPAVVKALKKYNASYSPIKLKIVSARNVFVDRLKSWVEFTGMSKSVEFLGHVSDDELGTLYQQALCLVQPSISEGFGLTGLEAMKAGVPVIASNKGALPEIYGNAALYVNPDQAGEIVKAINFVQQKPIKADLINKGIEQSKKYSWDKTTKETLGIYEHSLGI